MIAQNIQNLQSIARDNNTYKAVFSATVVEEKQFTTWVGTGNLKPSGTIAKSETLRNVITAEKERVETVVKILEENEAREYVELIKQHGLQHQFSDLSANSDLSKWVIDLVGGC